MKRKSSYLALVALLLLGCARTKNVASAEQAAPLPRPQVLQPIQPRVSYALSWQKPVVIEGLTVTLQKIEDSRCPKDVLCIWAGIAVANVQLEDSTGARFSSNLSVGQLVRVSLGNKAYQLALREITPYPEISDLRPAEKEARITVTAL